MEDQAEQLRELMKGKPAQATAPASSGSGAQSRKPRIITVASGKGGVGKTNVSVNMAIAYARSG